MNFYYAAGGSGGGGVAAVRVSGISTTHKAVMRTREKEGVRVDCRFPTFWMVKWFSEEWDEH